MGGTFLFISSSSYWLPAHTEGTLAQVRRLFYIFFGLGILFFYLDSTRSLYSVYTQSLFEALTHYKCPRY